MLWFVIYPSTNKRSSVFFWNVIIQPSRRVKPSPGSKNHTWPKCGQVPYYIPYAPSHNSMWFTMVPVLAPLYFSWIAFQISTLCLKSFSFFILPIFLQIDMSNFIYKKTNLWFCSQIYNASLLHIFPSYLWLNFNNKFMKIAESTYLWQMGMSNE